MGELKYIPGDLVIYQGQICKVKGSILHYTKLLYNVKDNMVDAESLQELPLTPQILEANGWKHDGGQYCFSFASYTGDKVELMGFFIEMFKEPHDMLKYKYFQITHEYKVICGCFCCHQLQHLLFGLGLPSELKV